MKSKHLLLTLLMALVVPWVANAQDLADYTFSTGTDATKWVTVTSTESLIPASAGDYGVSTVQNIGFDFPFGEDTYSQFSVNADGNLRLGSTVTTTNYYSTPFNSTNANQNNPKINAFGCDGYIGANNYVKSQLVGDNMLVVEFNTNTYSQRSYDYEFKWQVHLYSNGDIEIVFPEELPTTNPSSSHQCGLCVSSTDGWVIKLSDNTAEHFTSGSSTTNATDTWFDANRYYAFERPVWTCFKPGKPVATLTPGNGSIATLTWEPNPQGTETAWVLQYGTDANFTDGTYTEVEVETTPSINLTSLTAEQTYYARVKPDCDTDGTKWSTVSDAFTPTDAYVITVNEGTGTSYYVPFYYSSTSSSYSWSNYSNVASQFIIPATDLTNLQWGSIEKLTFYNSLATNTYGGTYTVYLGETSATTQTAYTDWATLTAVYTGTVSVSDNKMVIELDQPFTYTNSNLLVGFKLIETGTSGSSCTWKGVGNLTAGVSLYTTTGSTTQASFLPQMTIEFTPGEAPSCLPPTNLNITSSGQSATLTWESDAEAWDVAYSMDNTADPSENIIAASVDATTYTTDALTLGDHYFWVRTNCSATEQSLWAGPVSVHIGYCTPNPSNVDGNGISNVTFGVGDNIVNNDTPKATYADYSSQIGAVQAGVESTIAITYATGYDYGTIIWVDLDNSLSFEDSEIVYTGTSGSDNPTTLNAAITIPATQTPGDYMMRIGGADSGFDSYISGSTTTAPSACYTGNWACFQDYTLRVLAAPSCLIPTGLALSRNNDQITASWEGTADTYNIDINGTVTENVTSPYIFTAALSTTYTVKVQAICTGETSEWSSTQSITTPDCWGGHDISYTLTDSYGDGWNGASITFIEGCDKATLTCDGSSTSGTLNICEDYFAFIWNTGSYDGECGFTFTEGGETLFTKPSSLSDGQVLYTFGTQSCITPTGLAAGTPGKRSVELSWTSEANAWQICVNGDETNLIDVTENPYTLPNLTPNTDYAVKIRTNCGDEQSCWSDEINFTTTLACPAPTALNYANLKSTQVDLSWTNGGAEDWIVAYKKTADENFTEVPVAMADVAIEGTTVTYTLTDLDEETEYTVKVRDNCEASYTGDGVSEWTATTSFTTMAACAVDNVTVSNIGHYNATVNWNGESANGFTVKYREAEHVDGISEEFSSTSIPDNWTRYSGAWNEDGTGPTSTTTSGWSFGTSNFTNSHAYMNMYSDWKYWLVTPSITVGSNYVMSFDAAYTKYNATTAPDQNGTDDRFVVLISTDNKAHWTSLREWNNEGTGDAVLNDLPVTFQPVAPIDLSAYNGQTVYIAFYGASTQSNTDNHLRIDNLSIGVTVPATAWQDGPTTTATTADLSQLTAGIKYDVKVVPNCDETLASDIIQFTTLNGNNKYFLTEGDWNTATNWMDEEMPAITDNAELRANATINNGTVAAAKKITINSGKTLTINDGGQLMTDNSVTATVKKNITGYGTGLNANGKPCGYYLIGNPLSNNISYSTWNTPNTTSVGLVTTESDYDLYQWYRTSDDEWRNYKASTFSLSNGTGYLYANAADVELTFTGTVKANNVDETKSPSFAEPTATLEFNNWNLFANPFVCNAYITDATSTEMAFYRMNTTGDNYEAATGAIAPMEGIFVQATAASQTFKFTRTAPEASISQLNINLTQAVTNRGEKGATDNAIIRFGEGNTLEKFSFRENSTKVYIPMDNKDYAVVNAGNVGEMPVSFKAEHNGSYTLSFNAQEVSFSYLHLIDNMTGADVDLLANPSYSFNAQTTDYASRFRLVFATGSSADGDSFGFINGMGNLCIFGIEGTATVQVVDVLGHVISSETFSGSYERKLNAAPGVYMVRLIQGNDVKVQKMIVR